jgi:GntR family phosphonate transport system transcriptional regulator
VPVSFAIAHLPLPRFAGIEVYRADSISAAFERYGVGDYRRATTRITARNAEAEIAARLELAPGRAVLVVESVNVDAAGVPIQATTAFFAADRVEIVVET